MCRLGVCILGGEGLFFTVPVLNDELVSLTVGELNVHSDIVLLITASVRQYGRCSSTYLRTVRSGELAVECVTIAGIVEAEIERMFLTVSRQVLNKDKLILGCDL